MEGSVWEKDVGGCRGVEVRNKEREKEKEKERKREFEVFETN